MKLLIKEVGISGYDDIDDIIHSFWIIGQLESGRLIKIKAQKSIDLRNYIAQKIECIIIAEFVGEINRITENEEEEISSPIIRGEYLGEYIFPKKWRVVEKVKKLQGYHAVRNIDGVFLIDPNDIEEDLGENNSINIGDEIIFEAAGIGLEAWLPID